MRFNKQDIVKVSLKRIVKPTSCIHVSVPFGVDKETVMKCFEHLNVLEDYDVKLCADAKRKKNAPDKLAIFMDMASVSEAAIAIATVNGQLSVDGSTGLRVSFVDSSVAQEKAKTVAASIAPPPQN